MTQGDFKEILRRAHKRGTSLDDALGGAIRRAASWIEKNYTLQYMRRRFELELESGDTEVDVPDVRMKAFITPIRWNAQDRHGKYIKCSKVNFEDEDFSLDRSTSTVPTGFYLDGVEKIIFTSAYSGDAPLLGQGFLSRFSDLPIEDDESHWLFEHAESPMIVQCMLELGVVDTRDERTYSMYLKHREDQMKVLMNADYETQYSGADISL